MPICPPPTDRLDDVPGAVAMETAFDLADIDLDDEERVFLAKIREHGWFRTEILADEEGPGFSFTSGLWATTGRPEIMTFSLKGEVAHRLFWNLFERAQTGEHLPVGVPIADVLTHHAVTVFPIAQRHDRDYLGWSSWFYRHRDFPCLQLVWPDRQGLFPWQPGFNEEFRDDQLDLTERGWLQTLAQ
jgi:hypothetical protein